MDITIDYTTGAGPAALYLRQRNFAGKYANFTTLEWDAAESADSKAFFAEPDPVNAPGFYAVAVTPIAGGSWPLEVVEAATGLILYKGETEAAAVAAPTLNEIRAAIIDDHGPGLYGPGVAAEYAVRVTAVVAGSDPAVPIPDVAVTLLNADETVTLDQRHTDSLGQAIFPAIAGTYILRHRKAGYSFADDQAVVEAADVIHICAGTAYVIPAIATPGMQTLIISAKELGIQWAVGDEVLVTPAGTQFVGGSFLIAKSKKATIAANGIAQEVEGIDGVEVDIGAAIKVTIRNYTSEKFAVDAVPVKNISEYLP